MSVMSVYIHFYKQLHFDAGNVFDLKSHDLTKGCAKAMFVFEVKYSFLTHFCKNRWESFYEIQFFGIKSRDLMKSHAKYMFLRSNINFWTIFCKNRWFQNSLIIHDFWLKLINYSWKLINYSWFYRKSH